MVSFEDVDMSYEGGPPILRDVRFNLEPLTFHFLTGESGVGKSSLLRMIYLAQLPTQGRVCVFGQDTRHVSRKDLLEIRRKIGIVFQDFRLIAHLTALENVALPLRISGTRDRAIWQHAAELLHWVGLKHELNVLPHTLSGGQQQRVAIARAVITRPKLLLADEPTGNVDTRMSRRLLQLFEKLHAIGTTVVVATHDEALIADSPHPRLNIAGGVVRRLPAPGGRAGPAPSAQGRAEPERAEQ